MLLTQLTMVNVLRNKHNTTEMRYTTAIPEIKTIHTFQLTTFQIHYNLSCGIETHRNYYQLVIACINTLCNITIQVNLLFFLLIIIVNFFIYFYQPISLWQICPVQTHAYIVNNSIMIIINK